MSWVDYVGFLAALTVLATFCMDTILPLRGLAIASNILFIVYGTAGQLYPVLLLHALLLPINISKIVQLVRKNRFDARVASGEDRTVDCVPFTGRLNSRNDSRAFDQTTPESRPVTLNQLQRWRRSTPA
jgi:CRP/FNR family transcriptional regulator, cyclic AMP receptor protein